MKGTTQGISFPMSIKLGKLSGKMTRLTIRWRVLSYLLGTDVSGGITDISYESFKMSSTTCLLRVVQYQSCSIPSDSEVQRCRRMREKEVCP